MPKIIRNEFRLDLSNEMPTVTFLTQIWMLTLNADLVFRGVENLQSSGFQTLNITPFVEVPKYKLCNVTGG